MLAGIVVSNAIVLLDAVRQLRESGISRHEALLLAGQRRIRPIVITSLTTVLALLPLAFGFGAGAALRAPMALAVMGGLTASTLLTLVVIPCVYEMVEDWREKIVKRNDDKLLNRKIFISVLFVGICLLGVVSFRYLPLELYPNTELPMLLVRITSRIDVDPSYMESNGVMPHRGRGRDAGRRRQSAFLFGTPQGHDLRVFRQGRRTSSTNFSNCSSGSPRW